MDVGLCKLHITDDSLTLNKMCVAKKSLAIFCGYLLQKVFSVKNFKIKLCLLIDITIFYYLIVFFKK